MYASRHHHQHESKNQDGDGRNAGTPPLKALAYPSFLQNRSTLFSRTACPALNTRTATGGQPAKGRGRLILKTTQRRRFTRQEPLKTHTSTNTNEKRMLVVRVFFLPRVRAKRVLGDTPHPNTNAALHFRSVRRYGLDCPRHNPRAIRGLASGALFRRGCSVIIINVLPESVLGKAEQRGGGGHRVDGRLAAGQHAESLIEPHTRLDRKSVPCMASGKR